MGRRSYAILWGTLSILFLGVSYFVLHASMGGRYASGASHRTFRLSIAAPYPGEELPVFKATQGDIITVLISSDRPGEVHVHGYNKKVVVNSGSAATLTFAAQTAGLYPLHLHERLDLNESNSPILHRHLAALEVQPK